MTKARRVVISQYIAATMLAVVMAAAQIYDVLLHLDDGVANAKQMGMPLQIRQVVLADSRALFTVLLYFSLFLGAHFLLATAAVALYRGATRQLDSQRRDNITFLILFVAATLTCAVMWNRRIYPGSIAFPYSDLLLAQTLSPLLFWGLNLLLLGAAGLALLGQVMRRPKSSLAIATILACSLLPSCVRPAIIARAPGDPRPDVIIIGIDSLRPDFLPRNGFPSRVVTPHLNKMLAGMVNFDDALTPMARTFVAYMSILTGQEPLRHGARFNLYPRDRFDRHDTVAWQFKAAGYHTLFAIDEARFANFDGSFGFDEVVAPPAGLLDFAIGGTFDSVGTNLFLTVPVIRHHLSHVYGNRAAYRLYRADDHSDRIRGALADTPPNRPLMLVSHFCLPHWPYLRHNPYAKDTLPPIALTREYADAPNGYMRALHMADIQVGNLIEQLKAAGRLENAIVVVLSDHGEGLGMARDRFQIQNTDKNGVTTLAASQYGHGGYALADSQYRVVLAMQKFVDGRAVWAPSEVKGPASLLDVAPTVLEITGIEGARDARDGMSLLPALNGELKILPERVRFVESGERAASVERAEIDEKKVAAEMSHLYTLTPDLRFEINGDLLGETLAGKQRGAWLGRYGVLAKPAGYLGDRSGSCWQGMDFSERSVSCISYPASDPVYARLQKEVCQHYARDGDFFARWCGKG